MNPMELSVDALLGTDCIPYEQSLPKGLFTGITFFEHLVEKHHNKELWVMTFTASLIAGTIFKPHRLLFSIGESHAFKKKQLNKIHTKLFIVLKNNKPIVSYIGSQNFVLPTHENLMVQLDTKYNKAMMNYFNHHWQCT